MRDETAKTLNSTGTHSTTTQPSEVPKLAPATVAVSTAAGSRSAAPAMIPGMVRAALWKSDGFGFSGAALCAKRRASILNPFS